MLATAAEEGLIRSNPAAGLRLGRLEGAARRETRARAERGGGDEGSRTRLPTPTGRSSSSWFRPGCVSLRLKPLTKADVDFDRRRVRITKRLYQGGLDAPKSRNGVREVSLDPAWPTGSERALPARAGRQRFSFLRAAAGRSTARSSIELSAAPARRAGIEWPVGLHTLRHTAASIMWRRGVNREQIRRVLGHASWDFTASPTSTSENTTSRTGRSSVI